MRALETWDVPNHIRARCLSYFYFGGVRSEWKADGSSAFTTSLSKWQFFRRQWRPLGRAQVRHDRHVHSLGSLISTKNLAPVMYVPIRSANKMSHLSHPQETASKKPQRTSNIQLTEIQRYKNAPAISRHVVNSPTQLHTPKIGFFPFRYKYVITSRNIDIVFV